MKWTAPWDLRRRGRKDAERHQERVREAIRDNLHHLIIEEAIITSQGNRKVKIPIKYLTHYHFRYGEDWKGVGSGPGNPGDVIAEKHGDADKQQPVGAGDQPGEAVYEAEVSFDEIVQVMLEDLNLPWLKPTDDKLTDAKDFAFNDVRKRGLIHHLDKRRSLLENIKRRSSRGTPGVGPFNEEDLRFRIWTETETPSSRAAVYMLMDRSASMTSEKRYIVKGFYFWLTRFLKIKYDRVDLVFIAHDVTAHVVSEEDFFLISSGGGTKCSSAYDLAESHMKESHPPASWNNYMFHFTDGDNIPSDNDRCRERIETLLPLCNMIGYGEIKYGHYSSFYRPSATRGRSVGEGRMSRLYKTLRGIDSDRLVMTYIDNRDEIYRALKLFLRDATTVDEAVQMDRSW